MKTQASKWTTSSLGKVANLVMGQSPESKFYSEEETGLPFLQGCAEFQARFPRHTVYCRQIKKIAPQNSILFSVRAPVGRINIADQPYIIGRGLAAITGINVEQDYLEQYLHFEESNFRNVSQGSTFEAINSSELSTWPIEHPTDKLEQSKIAEVLSKVDQAIEQTESLIAKQQRIKTGLMQDLLTRGIDEHGNLRSEDTHEFKNSPLGRIPVEWGVDKLENVSVFITSGSRGWARYYSEEGAIFIRIGNLTREHIHMRYKDVIYVKPPLTSEGKRTAVNAGDLLISITADLGIIAVIPDKFPEAYVNQHIALVRLDKAKIVQFFSGWFLAGYRGQSQFDKLNESGAKAGLNLPTIKNLLVPRMALSEQEQIVKILEANNRVSIGHQVQLHKLRSLKTALMQDLLTGKVRMNPLMENMEVSS